MLMQNHRRPTFVHIDLTAIAHNVQAIKKHIAPAELLAVVKADAYGHGALPIARTALVNGASLLGVALVEEGVQLREGGINAPILVMGGFFQEQIEAILEYNLLATVFDIKRTRALAQKATQLGKTAVVHLKVDSGMGRLGVPAERASAFFAEISQLRGLALGGVFTHFASSDSPDRSFALEQLKRFETTFASLVPLPSQPPLRHAANSGAVLNLPESYLDLVRVGISMYGYYPSSQSAKPIALKPALALKSKVISVKDLKEGQGVSYDLTHRAARDTTIAVVPIGYADGYNRRLSNQAEVLIHGTRCAVIGRVCMDQIIVNVGGLQQVSVDDEVVLIGRQAGAEISVYEICEKLDTIPYEVTCWISRRVPRVYSN